MVDPFTAPANTDPAVPAGKDPYDVAAPDFRLIGQMLAAGQADFAAGKTSTTGISAFISHPLDTLLTWAATFLAWFLSKLLCTVAFLMRIITSVDDKAAPGMDAVIRNSLAHVFGIPSGGTTHRKVGAGVSGEITGAQIGKVILDALKFGAPASAGSTLQPDDTAAANFLGLMARMGVEGWADGFIAEAFGSERLASVLELVPIMNDVLGLGRVSRRVLAPIVKILVADPYTWKLHLQYRPALWPEALAVGEFTRGKMTTEELDKALGKHGMSATMIDALVKQAKKQYSTGDFEYLVAHGHVSTDEYETRLQEEGYEIGKRKQIANLPEQRVLDAIAEKRWELFVEAYVRGDVTDDQLTSEINLRSFSNSIKEQMTDLARTRRLLAVKHLTRGEVETMIKAHIMNLDDLRTWMARENYPPDEETLLELYLLGQISNADQATAAKIQRQKDAAAAATARAAKQIADAAAAAAKLATKGVTTATFESLVEAGLRTFDDFVAFLKLQGLPDASIADLVDLLHQKIATQQAAKAAHDAVVSAATDKHLPLSQIEAAVLAGTIPITDLQTFMQEQKFDPADITTAVSYVQGKLDAAAAKAAAATAAKAAAAVKGISLPNLERAARLGLTTPAEYAAALTAAGFDQHSADLMTAILNAQIETDQATIAQRKAAAVKAAEKNISLPDLAKAVIAGLQPIGAYSAVLSTLGYDAADVATMTELLQLQVDTAADVAAKKAAAAAALAQKHVSLAQIERAVRLGVLTIDYYRAQLTAAGFTPADVEILAASLLAELAASKAAAARRTAVAGALGAKGVSLAQEEQLVRDGISTLDAYTAFLVNQGYSAATAGQLTQLLSDEIAQATTAAATHAAAVARAAQKHISLAAEEKSVVDGIRTMDDYAALLVTLGFDAVDQATLEALLTERLPAPVAA